MSEREPGRVIFHSGIQANAVLAILEQLSGPGVCQINYRGERCELVTAFGRLFFADWGAPSVAAYFRQIASLVEEATVKPKPAEGRTRFEYESHSDGPTSPGEKL